MTTLLTPTVHLNGTSREELLDQLGNALTALHVATLVLGKAAPNGRDYYPQGEKVIYGALYQHKLRLQKLQEVIAELEAIGEQIA
jgi:hypothetical protein